MKIFLCTIFSRFLVLVMIIFVFSGLTYNRTILRIAVTPHAQQAMSQIKKQYERDNNVLIELIVQEDKDLLRSIVLDNKIDLYISGNAKYSDQLNITGYSDGKPKIYGYEKLILWWKRDSDDYTITVHSLQNKNVHRVGVTNPDSCIYGAASLQCMNYYGLYEKAKQKLNFRDRISDIARDIQVDNLDIGFISEALLLTQNLNQTGGYVEINKNSYTPIAQHVVLLKYSDKKISNEVKKVYEFLFSKRAQSIFNIHGYRQ